MIEIKIKKIRILHCVETIGSGGVEQLKLIKAINLDRNIYEQAIICTQALGGLPKKFNDAGCTVYEIGVFRGIGDLKRYKLALRIIKNFKPDIIHGAVYEGVAVAALLGRLSRTKVVLGEETSDPVDRRWTGNLLYKCLTVLTHNMVAVSPAVQNYLINTIKVPSKKVTLINNGVIDVGSTSANQRSALREALGIGPQEFIIGSCGRLLDSHKRFTDLITAFSIIKKKYFIKAKLLIIGEGPDKQLLRNIAIKLQVENDVIFTGYLEDTRPYYDIMDIFALASAHEAFGLVLVEAMLAGLPIVATRVGGIPSIIKNGVQGFLVNPLDPEDIAINLIKLIEDSSLRISMGDEGKRRAMKEFSGERYIREFDALYQKLYYKK